MAMIVPVISMAEWRGIYRQNKFPPQYLSAISIPATAKIMAVKERNKWIKRIVFLSTILIFFLLEFFYLRYIGFIMISLGQMLFSS